jgi:hypothetical protein
VVSCDNFVDVYGNGGLDKIQAIKINWKNNRPNQKKLVDYKIKSYKDYRRNDFYFFFKIL